MAVEGAEQVLTPVPPGRKAVLLVRVAAIALGCACRPAVIAHALALGSLGFQVNHALQGVGCRVV